MVNNGQNGTRKFVTGMIIMLCVLPVLFAVGAYVRQSDLELIRDTKRDADATKRAFDTTVVGRTPEGFHRKDMAEWCEAFEKANRFTGVTCPDPYRLPGYGRQK